MPDDCTPNSPHTVAQGTPPNPGGDASAPTDPNTAGTQAQSGVPVPGAQAPDLPVVPEYAVSGEIDRGGMAAVYAAHDPMFDRGVAINVVHDGQDAGRFVVESKVTAAAYTRSERSPANCR